MRVFIRPAADVAMRSYITNSIQQLDVVDRLFPAILTGEKESTIRWMEQNIMVGLLKFSYVNDLSKSLVVQVFRSTELPLSEAAIFLGKSLDWPDDLLLEWMCEQYPDIQMSSIV